MNDYEKLFDCLDDIYQTVNDQRHWQPVLQRLAQSVKGGRGAIFSKNNETGHIEPFDAISTKAYKVSYKYQEAYFKQVYLIDEWTAIERKYELGEVCLFNDHLPFGKLEQTGFYKQWLQPQKISGGMAVHIFKAKKFRIVLHIMYSDNTELVGELYRNLVKLSPHLCRAASLWMTSIGIEKDSEALGQFEFLIDRYKLTKREIDVVFTLVTRATVQGAANSLHISENTVKSHVKAVKKKMGVRTNHEMMQILFSLIDPNLQR